MKIFLDECVDWRPARHIAGHEVKTARQVGWTAIENGELLVLVAQQFDVFVTVDRNLSYQQNLSTHPIAVVVLHAKTNRLADLIPSVPSLLLQLASARPSSVTTIDDTAQS